MVKCSSRGYRNGRQWVTTSKSLGCTKPGSIVNDKLWSRRAAKTGWKCVGSAWLFLRRCILLFPDRHLKPVSRGWHGQHHRHWCLWVIGGSCCRGHISRLSSTTQWSEPKLAWIEPRLERIDRIDHLPVLLLGGCVDVFGRLDAISGEDPETIWRSDHLGNFFFEFSVERGTSLFCRDLLLSTSE